jgi:hypothetical protein
VLAHPPHILLALAQKSHLIVKKFNMGAKEASAALGMGDDFDYPS